MNSDHLITLALGAAPDAVYSHIASPDGLRRWWTAGAEGSGEVHGLFRLNFRDDHWTEMRIEKLDPAREVTWSCVAQHEPGFEPTDEWVGTSVNFRLEPTSDGGTTLHFAHRGLAALDCFETCRRGWDFYIGHSLRALVETGKGKPDTPPQARAGQPA